MNGRATWVVALLLGLFALFAIADLALFTVGVLQCQELADIWFDKLRTSDAPDFSPQNAECSNIEEEFGQVVRDHIAVILALLTGAGLGAGKKDDRD